MTVIYGDAARDTHRIRLTLNDDPAVVDTMQAMIEFIDAHEDEDLVIIGPDVPMGTATEIAEKYRVDRPSLGVILLRRRVELATMAEALRAGIREVVMADDAEALAGACGRARSVSRQLRHQERRTGDPRKARIIMDPADPFALEPGEVLIAPFTDPAWTPLFVPAGAVVVNVGAVVSHAIIVSRELGMPCVVSVTDATDRIPDGAVVTVDGATGTVTVVSLP